MSCKMREQLLRNLCDTAKLDLSTREVSELQVDLTADDVAAQTTNPSSKFTTTVCVYRLNYLYLAYHCRLVLSLAVAILAAFISATMSLTLSLNCLSACLPALPPACIAACLSACPPACPHACPHACLAA